MAFVSANLSQPSRIAGFFSRLGERVSSAFSSASMAHVRMRHIEILNNLSDEELDAKGLQREDIVRYVFRDMYHI